MNEYYLLNLRMDATRYYSGILGTFTDSAQTPALQKVRGYAEKWAEMYQAGLGLLLYGDVGTGKSHAAGCLADNLLRQGVCVRMADAVELVSRIQADFGAERGHHLQRLVEGDLLVLDNLGAQRSTAFARECVLDLVNRRMATDPDERRIYDRVRQILHAHPVHRRELPQEPCRRKPKKATQILGSHS